MAYATSHEQVVGVVRACHEFGVPIVARGRGTNTTGATVPIQGGLVLSLERMDKTLASRPANRARCASNRAFNQTAQDEAGKHGFFWPPDPTSAAYCTVGGNIALNAAGPRAKYGATRENIRAGRRHRHRRDHSHRLLHNQGRRGYDLTRLLIGFRRVHSPSSPRPRSSSRPAGIPTHVAGGVPRHPLGDAGRGRHHVAAGHSVRARIHGRGLHRNDPQLLAGGTAARRRRAADDRSGRPGSRHGRSGRGRLASRED